MKVVGMQHFFGSLKLETAGYKKNIKWTQIKQMNVIFFVYIAEPQFKITIVGSA